VDKVKFRSPVVPGDQLRLEAQALKTKPRTAQVAARALVHGKVVAEAQFVFMLVDADAD
jgi:3-hydroxyacyl-[acyl-carrier-protein] dehydratase